MSEITIIILTFNSIKFIKSCLDSICCQSGQDSEVIVVDNGSRDGTASFIKENYPEAILIENKENFGAAKARNQGIEIAKGRWVMALDCDVILEQDFLKKIISFVKETEGSIGTLQPRILNMDKRTIYSCGIYLSKSGKFYDIGRGEFSDGKFSVSKYIFGACSAAALYRKQMLEEIREDTGYFDERFFFLVEDVDLAFRAQRRGWKTLYCPELVCYHTGNSSGISKKLRQYFCWRNRRLLLNKCRLNRFKLAIAYFLYDLPRLTLLFLTNPYVRNEVKRKLICSCQTKDYPPEQGNLRQKEAEVNKIMDEKYSICRNQAGG